MEIDTLVTGLIHWGGVMPMTDDIAVRCGFRDAGDFWDRSLDLVNAIKDGQLLSDDAWAKAIRVTDVALNDPAYGLGYEWEDFSQYEMDECQEALQAIKHKFSSAVATPEAQQQRAECVESATTRGPAFPPPLPLIEPHPPE